jgi:hypothetical protein
MNKFIFIVGVGRSGTSLIQSMFASNPDVASIPETSFIRRYVATKKLHKLHKKNGIKFVTQYLKKDKWLKRLSKNSDEILNLALFSFNNNKNSESLDFLFYKSMIQTCSTPPGSAWFVDKDPRIIEYIPIIKNILPQSHIVNIIRDPRDVLASKKKAKWSESRHVWRHIFANRVQLKIGRKQGIKSFHTNYHEIIYEDLIEKPDVVLKNLCKTIGVRYDNRMLSFSDSAKKLVSEQEISWKKETLGPLLSNNKFKWKTELNYREIQLTELCCKEAMINGDYEFGTNNQKLSFNDRIWILFGKYIIKFGTIPYIIYRNYTVRKACKKK